MNCHRCKAEIKRGDVFWSRPFYFRVKLGEVITIPPNQRYHRQCVPPSLFQSAREFPHKWGSVNSKGVKLIPGTTPPVYIPTMDVSCELCGKVAEFDEYWFHNFSGDNKDACPGARDQAWQTIPSQEAPL